MTNKEKLEKVKNEKVFQKYLGDFTPEQVAEQMEKIKSDLTKKR